MVAGGNSVERDHPIGRATAAGVYRITSSMLVLAKVVFDHVGGAESGEPKGWTVQ